MALLDWLLLTVIKVSGALWLLCLMAGMAGEAAKRLRQPKSYAYKPTYRPPRPFFCPCCERRAPGLPPMDHVVIGWPWPEEIVAEAELRQHMRKDAP